MATRDPETVEDAPNPETAGLKGRRARPMPTTAGVTPLSRDMQPPSSPPDGQTLHGLMAMQHPTVLLDPATMPVVRENAGHVSEARLARHYVVAEFTAHEQVLPPGCTTPITRTLWRAGNHVRRDAYELYVSLHGVPSPPPTPA